MTCVDNAEAPPARVAAGTGGDNSAIIKRAVLRQVSGYHCIFVDRPEVFEGTVDATESGQDEESSAESLSRDKFSTLWIPETC